MDIAQVKLDKGMYALNKSFAETLEALDPSERYAGSELEGLDAFGRQLKRFDIRLTGPQGDAVEKFFQTADSAVLFPEYVSRAVRQGIREVDLIPKLTAAVTDIRGLDYRSIASIPADDDKALKTTAEGASIPQTRVTTQENLIRLHKRGRMLVSSYEAIRAQRLDVFTVMLRQIGAYIARTQLEDAVDVLLNGDGNHNAAERLRSSGSFDYDKLLLLWAAMRPCGLTTMLASPSTGLQILSMDAFRDAAAGLNFHGTGRLITPFGAELIISEAVSDGIVIGLDKRCALEMVTSGGVVTEHDKLIDRQLERTAVTATYGFAKLMPEAVKVLEI